MTEKSLNKTLQRLQDNLRGKNFNFTPIVVSDSKGKRLQGQVGSISTLLTEKFVWWCYSGARIAEQKQWIKNNLKQELGRIGPAAIFLWLGTCDLTERAPDGQIYLRDRGNSQVDYIEQQYRELVEFLHRENVKVVVLEIPIYSIKYWNAGKTGTIQEALSSEDEELKRQIDELNRRIGFINSENDAVSPKLSVDLKRNRKKKGKNQLHVNWKLLTDGVHPTSLVSKVWLLKIATYCRRIRGT